MPCVKAHADILAKYAVPALILICQKAVDLLYIRQFRCTILFPRHEIPLACIVHHDYHRIHQQGIHNHAKSKFIVIIMQRVRAYNGKTVKKFVKLYPLPPCPRNQIPKKGRGKGAQHNQYNVWFFLCRLHGYLLLILSTVFAGCCLDA